MAETKKDKTTNERLDDLETSLGTIRKRVTDGEVAGALKALNTAQSRLLDLRVALDAPLTKAKTKKA